MQPYENDKIPTDPAGTGNNNTAAQDNSSWDWGAFWGGIGSIADSAGAIYTHNNQQGGLPNPQTQQKVDNTSQYVKYGVIALVALVALSLVVKFIK